MTWTQQQRAFAVEAYFYKNESVANAQNEFRTKFEIFPGEPVPSPAAIKSWVKNFREGGSVDKTKHKKEMVIVPRTYKINKAVGRPSGMLTDALKRAKALGMSNETGSNVCKGPVNGNSYVWLPAPSKTEKKQTANNMQQKKKTPSTTNKSIASKKK